MSLNITKQFYFLTKVIMTTKKAREDFLIEVEKFLTFYDGQEPAEIRTEAMADMIQEWENWKANNKD